MNIIIINNYDDIKEFWEGLSPRRAHLPNYLIAKIEEEYGEEGGESKSTRMAFSDLSAPQNVDLPTLGELFEAALALQPGQAVKVEFPTYEAAQGMANKLRVKFNRKNLQRVYIARTNGYVLIVRQREENE